MGSELRRIGPLALLLSCASAPPEAAPTPTAPTAPAPPKEATPVSDAPFTLSLVHTEPLGLRAALRNAGDAPQEVLLDDDLQPSELVLRRDGQPLTPFDERSRQKFDNTVYDHSFRTLAPGEELIAEEARIRARGATWSLDWGPFSFDDLPPGRYTAQAVFHSARDEWVDSTAQSSRRRGLWTGTVSSDEMAFELPALP